ncbi:MAG TPA: YceI family protein [Candidatus Sulfotelmatobacter sp.]|nr:YceI family protein [Candidatus Sulfotelmatobacter sp.]
MATTSTGQTSASVRYVIDTRASQFTVQAFAGGLISAVAHSPKIAIRDWTGVVQMSSTLDSLSLKVQVKSSSLEVLDELPDSDRREIHRVMNREVLESTQFPEVIYDSTQVAVEKLKDDLYRLNVRGRLNLHGMSNDQDIIAQVSLAVDSARAYGSFTLLQSDYNIRIASIAGGTLKLQDELKFYFYVVARKQE